MIDIKHLKTISTLKETGSLVNTARELFLTQSALSHQIKDLENKLLFTCNPDGYLKAHKDL